MVFFRTLRCAQKHINYSTKQHFDEWRSNFYSMQSATKTLKNKAKFIFWVLRPLLTVVQKIVKLLQMATKSLRFLCFRGFLGEPSTYLPPPTSPKKHWTITCSMICVVGTDPPSLPTSSNNHGNHNVFNDLGGWARVVVTTHLTKIL